MNQVVNNKLRIPETLRKVKNIVGIFSAKGGVGKSTISANLAHYFSSVICGRTTLVDFDTQASSSKCVRSIKPQKITVFKANLPLS